MSQQSSLIIDLKRKKHLIFNEENLIKTFLHNKSLDGLNNLISK